MAAATVAGRPAGRLMAMPLIVINMGAEMLYILAHRLDAQKIGDTKSVRVLEDVVRTMFDPAFVEELFRPHDTYSRSSTRGIFDKLAHSSIMRLNKNSMDKLYDLMTMGFKYQILQCVCADQLYAVTMRHLATVLALVGKASEAAKNVGAAMRLMSDRYGLLPLGEWLKCREETLRFLQDRRVKVSIFLQSNTQSSSGTIAIPIAAMLPKGAAAPGTVFYLRQGAAAFSSSSSSSASSSSSSSSSSGIAGMKSHRAGAEVARTSTFSTPLAADCRAFEGYDDEDNEIAPGANLFRKGSNIDAVALLAAAAAMKAGRAILNGEWQETDSSSSLAEEKGGASSRRQRPQRSEEEMKAQARAELNVLAGLMGRAVGGAGEGRNGRGGSEDYGGGGGGGGDDDDTMSLSSSATTFTLNLFPEGFDDDLFGLDLDGDSARAEAKVDTVRVDGNVGHKDAAKMMEELDLKDDDDDADDGRGGGRGGGDDRADAKNHSPGGGLGGGDDDDFDEMDMLALMDMAEEKK